MLFEGFLNFNLKNIVLIPVFTKTMFNEIGRLSRYLTYFIYVKFAILPIWLKFAFSQNNARQFPEKVFGSC